MPLRSGRCSWLALLLSFCILSTIHAAEREAQTPDSLARYVAKDDGAFRWELRGVQKLDVGTIYDLHLVSQEWHEIVWEHQLQVYQPAGTQPTDTLLLWNQGGTANDRTMAFGMDLAHRVGGPIAFLYGIPKQPLLGGKKEDALIAETFVRYLETKDDSWPLLFAMAKSLVKAMDALQAFSREQWQQPVKSFVVCGASKRGWTTWMTAAVDPRVKAIAPMVIDTLNMKAQGPYQFKSFGSYSEQIADYTARNLVPIPETPEADTLWRMVDPWSYRAKFTMPKLLINGSNDPYWTTDALNLYWDDLTGPKWVLYVPNAGHGLEQVLPDGRKDRDRALNGLAAFARHVIRDNPMPQVTWKHDDVEGQARITVTANPAPLSGRVWAAQAPTRDFRMAEWTERPVTLDGGKLTGLVAPSRTACVALFAELDYEIGGLKHQVSTQLRIVEPVK